MFYPHLNTSFPEVYLRTSKHNPRKPEFLMTVGNALKYVQDSWSDTIWGFYDAQLRRMRISRRALTGSSNLEIQRYKEVMVILITWQAATLTWWNKRKYFLEMRIQFLEKHFGCRFVRKPVWKSKASHANDLQDQLIIKIQSVNTFFPLLVLFVLFSLFEASSAK